MIWEAPLLAKAINRLLALALLLGGIGLALQILERSRPLAEADAIAAVIATVMDHTVNPAGTAVCVGMGERWVGSFDLPPRSVATLIEQHLLVKSVSDCRFDREREVYRMAGIGQMVPLISCRGIVNKAPSGEGYHVECAVYRQGPFNAIGLAFDVHRSFSGQLSVKELGSTWVS